MTMKAKFHVKMSGEQIAVCVQVDSNTKAVVRNVPISYFSCTTEYGNVAVSILLIMLANMLTKHDTVCIFGIQYSGWQIQQGINTTNH